MSRFSKLFHTIYQCKYHIVFCPKYRYRILQGGVAEFCKTLIYFLCRQKEKSEILELNIQVDHIHIVVSITPKYSVSAFMDFLKDKLSLKLLERYEKLSTRN